MKDIKAAHCKWRRQPSYNNNKADRLHPSPSAQQYATIPMLRATEFCCPSVCPSHSRPQSREGRESSNSVEMFAVACAGLTDSIILGKRSKVKVTGSHNAMESERAAIHSKFIHIKSRVFHYSATKRHSTFQEENNLNFIIFHVFASVLADKPHDALTLR